MIIEEEEQEERRSFFFNKTKGDVIALLSKYMFLLRCVRTAMMRDDDGFSTSCHHHLFYLSSTIYFLIHQSIIRHPPLPSTATYPTNRTAFKTFKTVFFIKPRSSYAIRRCSCVVFDGRKNGNGSGGGLGTHISITSLDGEPPSGDSKAIVLFSSSPHPCSLF